MAADPVLRPAAEPQGRPSDVMLVGSGPTVLDVYVRSSVETSLYGQRLDRGVLYVPTIAGTASITLAAFTSTASGTVTPPTSGLTVYVGAVSVAALYLGSDPVTLE